LLIGKTVGQIWRQHARELVIEFTDGTRLFVDKHDGALDFSVTGSEMAYD
jgi:hypothetical protein